ncbi:MAG TPA: ATP-binding protein [Terracidiphilus sp.]|nr:ATP-binding protein [Terracidiphilus sp.]
MKPWVEKAMVLLASSLEPPHHELNEIDWKSAISPNKQRLVEHLCAFANHPGGGWLVYGIGPDSNFVGITPSEIESTVNQLTNLGRDAIEPSLQLDHLGMEFRGHQVLFVYIPESAIKPVHRKGRQESETHIRSGGTTRTASRQEVGSMMLQSKTPRWEDLHAAVLMSDDELLTALDIDPILEMLGKPILVMPEERLKWMAESSFIDRHSSGGGYVTNLGAISAAKRLAEFPDLARKAVRVIVYDGTNKETARNETEGKMGYALSFQRMLKFVEALLPTSEVIEQALRQKRTMYPELALREIIANAIIHQDFSISGAGPLIEIYSDRIEISNPGCLLPSKTLDRLIGTEPESRNEKLARAFRMYKICEERGSGLLKAGIQVELYGLPPIKFEEGANHFKVTLYAPRTFAQMTHQERINACYQHAVLKYFSSSAMTNKSLRERLKMPEKQRSMVSVLIQEAIDEGHIVAANPENKSKKFAEYIPAWAGS